MSGVQFFDIVVATFGKPKSGLIALPPFVVCRPRRFEVMLPGIHSDFVVDKRQLSQVDLADAFKIVNFTVAPSKEENDTGH